MSLASAHMLIGTGLIHCGFGLAVPELREPLLRTITQGTIEVVDMADRYQRECAFWFQFGGVVLIAQGCLLQNYCRATGLPPPAWLGWFFTGVSALSVVVMPQSGFWLALGQGLYMLYKNRNRKTAAKKLD